MSEFGVTLLGKSFTDLTAAEPFAAYSGVEIVIDDETSVFAGSDGGRVLTIENPWGTQAMAENILARLRSFTYQPYEASSARLDPAAELGDAGNYNGLYGGIYTIDRTFNGLLPADVSAPQDEEIDHEYPYEGRADREIRRKFMAVESEFAIQSSEISAKVSQTGGSASSFGWQLLADHFSLLAGNAEVFRVDRNGAQVKGVVTATGGKIGNFSIGNTAIWNNISNFANTGGLTSGVYVGTDGIRLGQRFTVTPSGDVMATRLTVDTLVIGGTQVSAATLNSRANSAYRSTSSGGYCYTGAAHGYTFDSMANGYSSVNYLQGRYGRFSADVTIGTQLTVGGVPTFRASNMYIGGHYCGLVRVVVDGVTYHLLGYNG